MMQKSRWFCAVTFCINNQCNMPLHITDGLGGSSQLIKIINRLGICSSTDTLASHIQYVTNMKEAHGAENE